MISLSQHCSKSAPVSPLVCPHLCSEGEGTPQDVKYSSHHVISSTPKKYDFRVVLVMVLTQPQSVAGIVLGDISLTFSVWTQLGF